ncbi:MAG: CxxC-x17-CxxC domain-containing protein [Patescibacteria group bacterium]
MGNFDRGNRGGGRSFDRRGGFGDRRGNDRGRGGFAGGAREMHQTVCSNCGRNCEVPFLPTSNKPVYCSDCFEKMGNDRGAVTRVRSAFQPSSTPDQGKSQFDALNSRMDGLNAKLEKILKLLEPQIVVEAAPVSVGEAIKEAKPLKVKKTAKKTAPVIKK